MLFSLNLPTQVSRLESVHSLLRELVPKEQVALHPVHSDHVVNPTASSVKKTTMFKTTMFKMTMFEVIDQTHKRMFHQISKHREVC